MQIKLKQILELLRDYSGPTIIFEKSDVLELTK